MGGYVNGVASQTISPSFTGTTNIDELRTSGKVYLGNTTPIVAGTALVAGDAWVKGRLQIGDGILSRADEWGTSIFTCPSTGMGTAHIGTCTFDLTGGAYENLLTVVPTGGWTFASTDVGKIILLIGGSHVGAVALIEQYIDTTNVTLTTCGWDADVAVGTACIFYDSYLSFTSPQIKINNIEATATWHNRAYAHTSEFATRLYMEAAAAGTNNLRILTDAAGYTNTDSVLIRQNVGALASGNIQYAIRCTVDDSLCTTSGADIAGVKFIRIGGSSPAPTDAVRVGTGFAHAVHIDGSVSVNPGYGYTFVPTTFAVTDHVNSGGGGNDSFINDAVNTQMFTADNSGILIGSDTTFSIIEYIQQIAGSATITPTWEYSTGDGTWATLSVSDTTTGFRFSGKVSFVPPGSWAASAHAGNAGGGGAITNAFYIRITRTANTLATPPTEKYFKVWAGTSLTETYWRGDGTVKPVQMDTGVAPNDSLFISATGASSGSIVYKTMAGAIVPL